MSDPTRFDDERLRDYLERLTQRAGHGSAEALLLSMERTTSSRHLPRQMLLLVACTALFAAVLGAGLAIRLASTGNRPAAPATSAPIPQAATSPAAPSASSSPSPSATAGCASISAAATPALGSLPPARGEAAMAADPRDCSLLLFGGSLVDGRTVLSDTWRWADGTWTQLHPSPSPPPRVFGAMAFDPATSQMVLYGGGDPNAGDADHGDTWTWNGSAWTELHPATSPPRGAATMAYDTSTARLLLFTLLETWAWDGGTWVRLGAQPKLHEGTGGALLVTDPGASPFLFQLYSTGAPPSTLGVYQWRSEAWVEVTPAAAGPTCIEGAAFEPRQATITVVACEGSQWRYSLSVGGRAAWQMVAAQVPSGARRWTNILLGPDDQTALLFGGSVAIKDLLHDDLWSWDGSHWTRLTADSPACSGALCH